jgi:hypothetical protein
LKQKLDGRRGFDGSCVFLWRFGMKLFNRSNGSGMGFLVDLGKPFKKSPYKSLCINNAAKSSHNHEKAFSPGSIGCLFLRGFRAGVPHP